MQGSQASERWFENARPAGYERMRLVGPQEIATLHASPIATAWRWRGRRRLPAPDWTVSGHELWDLRTIENWSKHSQRSMREGDTRWNAAIGRWASHLNRMVPDGQGGVMPDPTLSFTQLYDLLCLGQEETRLGEIGMPSPDPAPAASAPVVPVSS